MMNYYAVLFIFYLAMMLSKLAHPLWFEVHGSLSYFGVNYSAMALMGIATVFYSHIIERLTVTRSLMLGFLLYASALFLRIFYDSLTIVLLAGLSAGAGASIILLCFRSYISSEAQSEQRDRLLSGRKVVEALATILAGVIPLAVGFSLREDPLLLKYLIIISGSLCLLGIPLAKRFRVSTLERPAPKTFSLKLFRDDMQLALGICAFSLLCGAYTSFVQPFIYVILKRTGFDVTEIGLISLIFAAITMILSPAMVRVLKKYQKRWTFLLTEILLAATTIGIALLIHQQHLVLLFTIFRAAFLAISAFAQESIEYDLISGAKHRDHLVGLILSSFLVGDMLGGALGGFIAQRYSEEANLLLAAIMILGNGVGFYVFSERRRDTAYAQAAQLGRR